MNMFFDIVSNAGSNIFVALITPGTKSSIPVTLNDFNPFNGWIIDMEDYSVHHQVQYIIDVDTRRRYSHEKFNDTQFKCMLLAVATPLVHLIGHVGYIALKIVQLVTLHHFWKNISTKESYKFGARLKEASQDLLRIVLSPLTYVGLELTAVYGVFAPRGGAKVYATFERVFYGKGVAAPCFQPDSEYHLFGGKPNTPYAW